MLFIFDASGSPLKVVPEKVFQGSNKANTVYFAMPMVAQPNLEVNVQYRLPTGDVLPRARMISQGKIEGVTVDGMPVFVWTIDLTLNVTSFVGQVTMQFFVQFGEEIIATAAAEFVVSKGVPVKLPVATDDQKATYDSIVATLSSIETVLIDTASSPGFEFAVLNESEKTAVVTGYDTSYEIIGMLRVAPYTIIGGQYYKVVAYGEVGAEAAVVNSSDVELPGTLVEIRAKAFLDIDYSMMPKVLFKVPESVNRIEGNAFALKFSSVTPMRFYFAHFPDSIVSTIFGTPTELNVIEIYCPLYDYDNWKWFVDNFYSGYATVKSVVDVDYLNETLTTTLTAYQTKQDNGLNTTAKTIVGAINENKQAIADEANTRQEQIDTVTERIKTEEQARALQYHNLAQGLEILKAKTESDFTNYYQKSETYSQAQVNKLLSSVNKPAFDVVDELPAVGEQNVIYLVPKASGSTDDVYDEYIWITDSDGTSHWEHIGSTAVDLSNYYTKAEITALLNDRSTTIQTACNGYTDVKTSAVELTVTTACNAYTDTKVTEALGMVETALAQIDTGTGV